MKIALRIASPTLIHMSETRQQRTGSRQVMFFCSPRRSEMGQFINIAGARSRSGSCYDLTAMFRYGWSPKLKLHVHSSGQLEIEHIIVDEIQTVVPKPFQRGLPHLDVHPILNEYCRSRKVHDVLTVGSYRNDMTGMYRIQSASAYSVASEKARQDQRHLIFLFSINWPKLIVVDFLAIFFRYWMENNFFSKVMITVHVYSGHSLPRKRQHHMMR